MELEALSAVYKDVQRRIQPPPQSAIAGTAQLLPPTYHTHPEHTPNRPCDAPAFCDPSSPLTPTRFAIPPDTAARAPSSKRLSIRTSSRFLSLTHMQPCASDGAPRHPDQIKNISSNALLEITCSCQQLLLSCHWWGSTQPYSAAAPPLEQVLLEML